MEQLLQNNLNYDRTPKALAQPISLAQGKTKDRHKKRQRVFFLDGGLCPERRGHEGRRFLHTRKPHRHDKWEALNLRVEFCNVREQNRKFTTEIAAEHHFSAKRWLTSLHTEQRSGVGCQGVTSKPPPTAQCWGGMSRLGHRCQSPGVCWGLAAMKILWGGYFFGESQKKIGCPRVARSHCLQDTDTTLDTVAECCQ